MSLRILPITATADAYRILLSRSLRAISDGFIAIALPVYLLATGYDALMVGSVAMAAMLGSAFMTLLTGMAANQFSRRSLMRLAALIMCLTGIGFAISHDRHWLLMVAFFGTLNPSSGDVSLFVPLEHAALSHAVAMEDRTALFARYSFVGTIGAALGALSAGLVDYAGFDLDKLPVAQTMFAVYALMGAITWLLYRQLTQAAEGPAEKQAALGPSRRKVYQLAALFSLDSFGGGFVLNSLLLVWLYQRFGLSAADAGKFFFVTGLCSACSQLLAARLAARIGLLKTMVFTHIPANIFLIAAAFAPNLTIALICLVLRGFLSQMDVPARTSYVMSVVQPAERPAAASLTAVPRSLSAALSPGLAGYLLAASSFGWPLLIAGITKLAYDITLWRLFAKLGIGERRG